MQALRRTLQKRENVKVPEPMHAAILLLHWQSAHSATRIHHTRCEVAKGLPCAAAKGAECDACMAPPEHVIVVPGRVVDAVRRAAVSNTVLPSVFERKCGFGEKGTRLFPTRSIGMSAFYKVGLNFWYSIFFGFPNSNTEDQNQYFLTRQNPNVLLYYCLPLKIGA